MKKHIATLAMSLCALALPASMLAQSSDPKLSGIVIGTQYSVDYNNGSATTSVNTKQMAFDGDFNTCFASYDRSFTWVGLQLDEPHVITRVGWAARNDDLGPGRMQLGVFQGANQPDFSDALPIYVIPEHGRIGEMMYADVTCSKGFKYIRYVGPHDARCNVAELEFYGHPGTGDEKGLYQVTNLPTVVVNTPNMEWFHSDDKSYEMNGSSISVIDNGKFDVSAPGQIRGRGNASWQFEKKPFRIKFDKKQTVLGGPAKAKKWTMINNYGDKTLMRNMVAFSISRDMEMAYTPACHFVDLVFNGEYQGTYQLCDQVEVNPGRVVITEMEPTDVSGEALTGGYFIEIDGYASQEPADEWFTSQGGHNITVTIKSPDPGVTEQYNYIRNRFSQLERAIFNSYFTNEELGYRSLLDLDSYLRYFIVEELCGNPDAFWSTYLSLDRGAKRFVVGPVWDFDIAFDNDYRVYPTNSKRDFLSLSGASGVDGMYDVTYRIIKMDKGAKERLAYLWSFGRERLGLDYDNLAARIDGYANDIRRSQDLNFKRWNILNTQVHMNPRALGSFDAEVNALKSFLKERLTKLDGLIGRVDIGGVEAIESDGGMTVTPVNGAIEIMGNGDYEVYNLQGALIASGRGDATVSVSPGIYLVKADTRALKVAVR